MVRFHRLTINLVRLNGDFVASASPKERESSSHGESDGIFCAASWTCPTEYPPTMSEDHDESELHMFEEPEGYFQPDKLHSYQNFTLETGETLNLRLVGHNPLWVSYL